MNIFTMLSSSRDNNKLTIGNAIKVYNYLFAYRAEG